MMPWTIRNCRQVICVVCAALALLLVMPASDSFGPNRAQAQEAGERRGGGILRFLFPRQEKRERPTAPAVKEQKRRTTPRRSTAPAQPVTPAVEKAQDAKRVLVIGDFLAGSLADGLAAAYAQNPDIVVIDRANGSSGLVRNDYYDWPGNIGSILDTEKPAAVVFMIGANDRQQMVVAGNREQPVSDAWIAEYERRTQAVAKIVRDNNLPLLWVGALPFKSSSMSSDMITFNDIYRRVVTDADGEFIDVWDGFVDESGNFVANGPDMNGQPAQLRGSDGINVTRPGRRKIAFYLEKPLARLLGLSDGDVPDQPAPGLETDTGPAIIDPAKIDRTPPIALDEPAGEPSADLLGADVIRASGEEATTPAERLARQGVAPEARPGRVDDFTARQPKPAAPSTPTAETTGAVPR